MGSIPAGRVLHYRVSEGLKIYPFDPCFDEKVLKNMLNFIKGLLLLMQLDVSVYVGCDCYRRVT